MLGLLVFSLALAAPASTAVEPGSSGAALGMQGPARIKIEPGSPLILEEQVVRPIDDMEIHPDPDTCYRIRAFLFSKGQNPRFLRETTCGPKLPSAKKMDAAPGFKPLHLKAKPAAESEQEIPVP